MALSKKVLIITYYWPPSGGSGVQRWLKFVKYLCRQNWEPWVFTPENPSFTIQDESLLKDVPPETEVIKLPIWEPYQAYFKTMKLLGMSKVGQTDLVSTQKRGLIQAISTWIRGNFFIPDARRFWIKPSVTVLSDLISTHHIERIITTGPPHSMHLIGLRLKRKFPHLKWVADFRDPWSEWDLLDSLSLTSWARKRHRKLEKEVLIHADRVITIAPYHAARLEQISHRKVDIITNGFDPEDFKNIAFRQTDVFTIRHVGIVDELRDPRSAMTALREIISERKEWSSVVAVEFVGNVNSAFKEWIRADQILSGITRFVSYVPHNELVDLYASTNLQLLVLAKTSLAPGNLPGKFFEYIASGKPILAIGPIEGDAASILRDTGAGQIFEHEDVTGMRQFLIEQFQQWREGSVKKSGGNRTYSRERLTMQLIKVLESL